MGQVAAARLLLDRGAKIDRVEDDDLVPLSIACQWGQVDVARLLIERGADIYRATTETGSTPISFALANRHTVMAAWLAVSRLGWTRYFSEPRYKLVTLRGLAARGWARRKRLDLREEQLLDFLFPGERPNKRARRHQPRLPDDLFFSVIARYYCGGNLSAEEKAAAAIETEAAAARFPTEPQN